MVKERPEEARNSPKGNFYFFLPLFWGELWRALVLFCFLLFVLFFVLSCFIIVLLKFQN